MEIELKYKVEDNVKWDRLKHSSELADMMEPVSYTHLARSPAAIRPAEKHPA